MFHLARLEAGMAVNDDDSVCDCVGEETRRRVTSRAARAVLKKRRRPDLSLNLKREEVQTKKVFSSSVYTVLSVCF